MAKGHVAIERPQEGMLRAIAEEAALRDADLDELEARLADPTRAPEELAALSLTIARAGRAASGQSLAAVRSRLIASGRTLEAEILSLAIDLLAVPPPDRIDRADAGYRYGELYVDDPVAAHWHTLGRWGPPIRPDPTLSATVARGPDELEAITRAIDEGRQAIVTFVPRRWSAPEPPARLVAAGLARSPSLAIVVRWSAVRSIGVVKRRGARHVAFELGDGTRQMLPDQPSIPTEALIQAIARLVERARS